jgi:hypothetical protein
MSHEGNTVGDTWPVDFNYRLTGTGWAEAVVRSGDDIATVTVSYLTDDALGDLLAACRAGLYGPLGEASCSWQEEPGEYVWTIRRNDDSASVCVEWYGEWRELLAGQPAETRFEATVPVRELSEAIAAAAERVLAQYGEDGYLETWAGDPFPHGELERLRAALSAL